MQASDAAPQTRPGVFPGIPVRAGRIALGCLLLTGAIMAATGLATLPSGTTGEPGPAGFPRFLIGLMLATGSLLVLQGLIFGGSGSRRWPTWVVAVIVVLGLLNSYPQILTVIGLLFGQLHLISANPSPLPQAIVLNFGPADFGALLALQLVIGIALACFGRLAALGAILAGLFLGTIGIDLQTGTSRFTFGLPSLLDGIDFVPLALGLIVVGDGVIALAHPRTTWALTRHAWGLAPGAPPTLGVDIAVRIAALVAIGLAAFISYRINNDVKDIVLLIIFGLLGLFARLSGWNRWLFMVAFAISPFLETNIRQVLILTRGEIAPALARPIAGSLAAIALIVIAGMLVAAIVRASQSRPVPDR